MYYFMMDIIEDLKIPGYPKRYPVFFMADDEKLKLFSAKMTEAIFNGFSPSLRKMCFTPKCQEGYTHEEVFEIAQKVSQISEEEYHKYKVIPHWDIVQDSIDTLTQYIEMVKVNRAQFEGSDLEKAIKEAMMQIQNDNDDIYKEQ